MTAPRSTTTTSAPSPSRTPTRSPARSCGSIPRPDNPFYTGDPDDNASKVWQLGLRNPFRIAFDDDGELFISNTGWFSWEEINSGGRGANFGWPLFEGGDSGDLLRAPGYADQAQLQDLYAAYEAGDLVITPPYRAFSHTEGVTEIEIDGLVGASSVYQGDVYPADIQGDFFFLDIADSSAIYSVDTDDRDSARKLFDLPDFRGPVVMTEGPDGYMYFGDIRQDFVGRWIIDEQLLGDRFEAETATLEGTVALTSINPGFSGTGYADFGTVAAVAWTVDVAEAGDYTLVFGYANGAPTGDRSLLLEVDGTVVERLDFATTGSWLSWDEQAATAPVTLAAGTHTIRLESDGGDGPNVDYAELVPLAPPAGTTGLEAEDAVLGGTVAVAAANPGFSGTGYADFGTDAADFVEWTIDVDDTGDYDLSFRYANGGLGEDRSLLLEVDDTLIERLDFAPTGTWADWGDETTTASVALAAGTHTIRLQSDGGEGPNLDALDLALASAPPAGLTGLEAEEAVLGGTVTAAAANPGFTGTGYADFGVDATDFVEWTIEVDGTGFYDLAFGYANGAPTGDRSLLLEVDDATVERLAFANTGTWADWAEQSATAPIELAAGTHTIRLQSDGGDGPNLDYLDVAASSAPPPPSASDVEAEDATTGGTVTVAADNPGYRGTGYVDFGTDAADFVEWSIEIDAAGFYDLAFGYANGAPTGDRSLLLEVDGATVERLDFANAGTWTEWTEETATAPIELAAGTHTVRLQSDGGDGPNVDYLDVAATTTPPVTGGLEAEDATLGGTVTTAADNPGYRGTGYADFGTDAADFVEWTVDITTAGLYDLAFGYANGAPTGDRSLLLEVDDTFVERLAFATTGTWTDWTEQAGSAAIDLDAGTHTIRLASDGGDGPNLDYLALDL
ncbi:MAG: carbohydrate-binding protein, partial [Deinococcus-Thermus bacterium]|nr:carbohydrate-binding protein [Deinococcota bacterium]